VGYEVVTTMNYEIVNSSLGYDGKILKVQVDEIRYQGSGRKSCREVVLKNAFAMVIPVCSDGSIVCIRQFRHPFREMVLSFPAGLVDAGEDPEAAARRELQEEAGFHAGRLLKLGELREVPECARSIGHLYIAQELQQVGTKREEGEATMELVKLKEDELRLQIRRGQICSTTVIAAVHLLLDFRNRSRMVHSWEAVPFRGCPFTISKLSAREKVLLFLFACFFLFGRMRAWRRR